ncbi:hypothetical protein [Yersinia phage vB_YenM_P778]
MNNMNVKVDFGDVFVAISKVSGLPIPCNKSPFRHTPLALKSAARNGIDIEAHEVLYKLLLSEGLDGALQGAQFYKFSIVGHACHQSVEHQNVMESIHKKLQNEVAKVSRMTDWTDMTSIQFYKYVDGTFKPVDTKGNLL